MPKIDADDIAQEKALAELLGTDPAKAFGRALRASRGHLAIETARGRAVAREALRPLYVKRTHQQQARDERDELILAAYRGGLSRRKIARVLGMSHEAVRKIVAWESEQR